MTSENIDFGVGYQADIAYTTFDCASGLCQDYGIFSSEAETTDQRSREARINCIKLN